ncbi:MAG: response regulator [Magnetococcales bacterium]|nr:response regulator [Magnetococcales bacterium]
MNQPLQPKILIVDDKPANLKALRTLLAQVDAEILEAPSGDEALGLMVEHELALMLLDVDMPGMDGYEVARMAQGVDKTKGVPIIFITAAYQDDFHRRKGYESGAIDYIEKPIDNTILLSKVWLFLDLYAAHQKTRQANEELRQEIVRRKETEGHLRLTRFIVEKMGDAGFLIDFDGRFRDVNEAACRTLEYSRDSLLGLGVFDIDPNYPAERWPEIWKTLSEQHSLVFESSHQTKTGHVFPVEIQANFVTYQGEDYVFAFVRNISQRVKTETALQVAREQAEAANRAKSAFLATMSHEIRTPLNSILGMGELLVDTKLTDTQAWFVKTLNYSGKSLLILINDILDLSKIEADQLTLEETVFDLRQLVDETMELFAFSALDKGIKLKHEMDEGVSQWVRGDPTRLRQVLLNLIGNAVKFTQAGQVTFRVEGCTNDHVLFKILDTGPGIPKEKQEEIFHPFTQADSTTTRKHGGTGLGLTICRRLVDLMGGRIELESEVGQGSAFTVIVPLPLVEADATPKGEYGGAGSVALSEVQKVGASPHSLNILLVEDSPENQMVVEAYLRNTLHQVTLAENGAEAVEKFKNGSFNLVLMDIQMPVMDGYEATRQIRTWESENRADPTPIIALTAHAMNEESESIKAAGCDLHLTKPIRKKRLLETIVQIVHQGSSPARATGPSEEMGKESETL